MSYVPALTMAVLCAFGGVIGFARTGSIPSVIAGVSIGALYGRSADLILRGDPHIGIQGAFAASVFLCVSSIPRALATKKPVPAILAVTGTAATAYYGKIASDLRLWPFA
ncbi:hypothetical protein FRC04_000641 [Tulasnella sp. 424]|nr:hypothetical protein FRC04_000641 [Tulasnella sp. 424]KAG8974910.1 hypothetical protein FRC05_006587 [Tulasnella sp. 425]